jgi:predicted acylesterase/phospholipase RssA
MKRAITLAGGGPAAGLHIGVLARLAEAGITFDGPRDVWALSCIGAWVGLIYNQSEQNEPRKKVEQTYNFFKDAVFRDDLTYSRFPINRVFGPDWSTNNQALVSFLASPKNYKNLILPEKILNACQEISFFMSDYSRWTEGDLNQLLLNHGLAVNPFIRFITSMIYLSELNGLARIYYPDSAFLKSINFGKIKSADPFIFHNAYNLTKSKLDLFCNKDTEEWRSKEYKPINAASLCACSALPYVEQTVEIDGDTYCEGALIDTVNFKSLIEDHPDLDEIWVCRIVDVKQIRQPKNLADSLANLCQLFAATVGEDDVKLFEYHVREDKKWKGTIIEIQVDSNINFEWSQSNLKNGLEKGKDAAYRAYTKYFAETGGKANTKGEVKIIKEPKPDLKECKQDLASARDKIAKLEAQLASARDQVTMFQGRPETPEPAA